MSNVFVQRFAKSFQNTQKTEKYVPGEVGGVFLSALLFRTAVLEELHELHRRELERGGERTSVDHLTEIDGLGADEAALDFAVDLAGGPRGCGALADGPSAALVL